MLLNFLRFFVSLQTRLPRFKNTYKLRIKKIPMSSWSGYLSVFNDVKSYCSWFYNDNTSINIPIDYFIIFFFRFSLSKKNNYTKSNYPLAVSSRTNLVLQDSVLCATIHERTAQQRSRLGEASKYDIAQDLTAKAAVLPETIMSIVDTHTYTVLQINKAFCVIQAVANGATACDIIIRGSRE